MLVSTKVASLFKHCGFVNIDYLLENKIYVSPSVILNILEKEFRKWKKPLCMQGKTMFDGGELDPTFGYTTIGSSTQTYQGSGRHVACVYNLSENGDATSISAYIALQDTGTASGKAAVYDLSGGHPDNRVGLTNSNDSITETFQWYEFTFASSVSLTAADYGLCVKPASTWQYKYDSGDTDQLHYNGDYNAGDPLDPWPGCSGHYSQKMSIYCSYTVSGGGLSIPVAMHHYSLISNRRV